MGAAPCTAMVFVWSYLTKGDAAYTLVQVAVNDLLILVAFAPIVAFLLGVGGITIPWDTLTLSVVLFVVIPLAGGVITRRIVISKKGLLLVAVTMLLVATSCTSSGTGANEKTVTSSVNDLSCPTEDC